MGEGHSIADIHDCVRIRSWGRASSARWYGCGGNIFLFSAMTRHLKLFLVILDSCC